MAMETMSECGSLLDGPEPDFEEGEKESIMQEIILEGNSEEEEVEAAIDKNADDDDDDGQKDADDTVSLNISPDERFAEDEEPEVTASSSSSAVVNSKDDAAPAKKKAPVAGSAMSKVFRIQRANMANARKSKEQHQQQQQQRGFVNPTQKINQNIIINQNPNPLNPLHPGRPVNTVVVRPTRQVNSAIISNPLPPPLTPQSQLQRQQPLQLEGDSCGQMQQLEGNSDRQLQQQQRKSQSPEGDLRGYCRERRHQQDWEMQGLPRVSTNRPSFNDILSANGEPFARPSALGGPVQLPHISPPALDNHLPTPPPAAVTNQDFSRPPPPPPPPPSGQRAKSPFKRLATKFTLPPPPTDITSRPVHAEKTPTFVKPHPPSMTSSTAKAEGAATDDTNIPKQSDTKDESYDNDARRTQTSQLPAPSQECPSSDGPPPPPCLPPPLPIPTGSLDWDPRPASSHTQENAFDSRHQDMDKIKFHVDFKEVADTPVKDGDDEDVRTTASVNVRATKRTFGERIKDNFKEAVSRPDLGHDLVPSNALKGSVKQRRFQNIFKEGAAAGSSQGCQANKRRRADEEIGQEDEKGRPGGLSGKIKLKLGELDDSWLSGKILRGIATKNFGKSELVECTVFRQTRHAIVVLRSEGNVRRLAEMLSNVQFPPDPVTGKVRKLVVFQPTEL